MILAIYWLVTITDYIHYLIDKYQKYRSVYR